MADTENDEQFSEDEQRQLIMALAHGQGSKGFTAADGVKVFEWASQIRSSALALDLVLSGHVWLRIDEQGELIFVAAPKATGED